MGLLKTGLKAAVAVAPDRERRGPHPVVAQSQHGSIVSESTGVAAPIAACPRGLAHGD